MNTQETHQEALDRLNLQVGDKVKILYKADSSGRGWEDSWINKMDKYIGTVGEVDSINETSITVYTSDKENWWNYPAYVLEVVERANQEPATTEEPDVQPIGWKVGDRWRHKNGSCGKSIDGIAGDMVSINFGETGYGRRTIQEVNEYVTAGKWIINPPETTSILSNGSEDSILMKANSLIYGDRQKEYGSAKKNFTNIAGMWSIILGKEVTPYQVVECMIALKQCRLINQPEHKDSWVDIAGYAGCLEKIEKNL